MYYVQIVWKTFACASNKKAADNYFVNYGIYM